MSKNVKESANVNNKDSVNDSSVMSKIACHYVSLPQVVLRRIDDPSISSASNPEENQTLKSFTNKSIIKQNIKKVSPKSKNIPARNQKNKISQQTKRAVSTLSQGTGKKSSLIKQSLTQSQLAKQLNNRRFINNKLLYKSSSETNTTVEKRHRGRPRKVLKIKTNPPLIRTTPEIVKKTLVKRQELVVVKKPLFTTTKTTSELKPKFISQNKTVPLNSEMSVRDEDSMTDELENSDSEKSLEESSDLLYDELIQSFASSPRKVVMDSSIKKQALSKNVIKLSGSAQKMPGAVIKSGIIRKNTIPIQGKSKPLMKPNQATSSVNVNQIKNMSSENSLIKKKMLISPIKQKQAVFQTSKATAPQIKQKAISVQSVEAINSKAKKPEPITQMSQNVAATKQTATVTPLSKARKSFTSGSNKVHFTSKMSKERDCVGVVESEPVNLLSKLVGLPISPSKLQVMPLSPQNASQLKPSTSPPPLTNIKSESTKTQYVSPTTHESTNKNAIDLLKILGDDNEAGPSQETKEPIKNGSEMKNTSILSTTIENETSMDSSDNGLEEEKPRTIYDLMTDINLIYPSWNLHIMPDTNSFCIAQISRGRLGIPVLKKCIELDEAYNAKVYVHQYHCKRFDGQYDSEESIIALIHEINALRA